MTTTPPDTTKRRPLHTDGVSETTASPPPTIPDGGDVAALIELSDERDAQLRLRHADFAEGYDIGSATGYDVGRVAAEDAAERDHQAVAARVLAVADPSGPEAREDVARRLRAAEAGCRRDALGHWRERWARLHALARDERYVREARMTAPGRRSYDQVMSLMLRDRERGAA